MEELTKELNIENMIYEVRGKQVMLDRDLAKLYKVETRALNQAVKRNIERFPLEFCFQLSDEEFSTWKSQIVISKNDKISLRRAPFAFTEQGIAMISTLLKSKIAIEVSIKIMHAFVAMRKYISTNLIEQKYINELVLKDSKRIDLLEETFSKFETKEKINEIFFEGQIYDSYSKIIDILLKAKENIIIIDSYADKYVLDMISKVITKVTLIISTKSRMSTLDIDKYQREYNNLTLIYKVGGAIWKN